MRRRRQRGSFLGLLKAFHFPALFSFIFGWWKRASSAKHCPFGWFYVGGGAPISQSQLNSKVQLWKAQLKVQLNAKVQPMKARHSLIHRLNKSRKDWPLWCYDGSRHISVSVLNATPNFLDSLTATAMKGTQAEYEMRIGRDGIEHSSIKELDQGDHTTAYRISTKRIQVLNSFVWTDHTPSELQAYYCRSHPYCIRSMWG